jgi:hypothetical protein
MPVAPKVDPAVQPETGAPDQGERLLTLFAAQSGDVAPEKEPEETAVGESETAEAKPSEEAGAEEVGVEEAAPTEETEETPETYEVKIDGQVEAVTLDELKAGYSRTGDYTRKTQAIAAKEREFEAKARAASEDRERYIEGLKNVEALLTQHADEPDWTKLADELDPAEYNRQRAQWDTRQRQVNALRTKREAEEQRVFAEREAAHRAYLGAEQARLLTALPEWKDEAKARTEQQKLTDYALRVGADHGITERNLAEIDSAFPILMLRKAMLYDELMAAKPKVVKQKVPTPSAKPGAKTQTVKRDPIEEAAERLSKTHDPKDFEDLILQRLIADENKSRR